MSFWSVLLTLIFSTEPARNAATVPSSRVSGTMQPAGKQVEKRSASRGWLSSIFAMRRRRRA